LRFRCTYVVVFGGRVGGGVVGRSGVGGGGVGAVGSSHGDQSGDDEELKEKSKNSSQLDIHRETEKGLTFMVIVVETSAVKLMRIPAKPHDLYTQPFFGRAFLGLTTFRSIK